MTSSLGPIIFRLINFGIIVAAGVYFYRRFGRKVLQEMFESSEKHRQSLRDEVISLGVHAQKIEQEFVEQESLGAHLAHTVEQWQLSVRQAIAARHHEKEALTSTLQRKAERVARHAAWLSLRRECLEGALKEATDSLTAFYADPTHAQEYLYMVHAHIKELSVREHSLGGRA